MDWTSYHKQDDIDGYTTYLAETYDFVDTESIGESYEGRKMQVLKVRENDMAVAFRVKSRIWILGVQRWMRK